MGSCISGCICHFLPFRAIMDIQHDIVFDQILRPFCQRAESIRFRHFQLRLRLHLEFSKCGDLHPYRPRPALRGGRPRRSRVACLVACRAGPSHRYLPDRRHVLVYVLYRACPVRRRRNPDGGQRSAIRLECTGNVRVEIDFRYHIRYPNMRMATRLPIRESGPPSFSCRRVSDSRYQVSVRLRPVCPSSHPRSR